MPCRVHLLNRKLNHLIALLVICYSAFMLLIFLFINDAFVNFLFYRWMELVIVNFELIT